MILADAIVRACEDHPDYLIETSTLTGAQTVALGARTPGVMGSDDFRDRVAELSRQVGENGWPYVQHRGGPPGFLKVLGPQTIAYADFRGNAQYISVGNLMRTQTHPEGAGSEQR